VANSVTVKSIPDDAEHGVVTFVNAHPKQPHVANVGAAEGFTETTVAKCEEKRQKPPKPL
jgi:hypothetical protein